MTRSAKTTSPAAGTAPRANDLFAAAVPPPPELSEGARREWAGLVIVLAQLGTAKHCDMRALALLCECLATETTLRDVLATEGLTIPGADGNAKTHPAARLLESTRNQAHRLLGDFGLIPRGRVAVRAAPPSAGVNPFAALIKPKRRPIAKGETL